MKVLLAYAYAGVGHKKAAEAIYSTLKDYKNVELTIVDALDYTSALFKFSYPRVYLFLINKAPWLWGFFYYLLDFEIVDMLLAPIRRFAHCVQAKKFIEYLNKEKPDVVVSTHFFPSEVVSMLKEKGIFKGKLVTVVTDFLPHSFWLAKRSSYFIGAIERTKKDLIRRGIEEDKIKVFGIPTDPKFSASKDKKELFKKLDIEGDFFNVLIMGGGFGTGPIEEIVNLSTKLEKDIKEKIQFLIICGKNKRLFEKLRSLSETLDIKMKIFSYMDNIDEFMEVSAILITKSGGLSVSEALSKKLPMIIINPIPGQETRNCRVLSGYGVGVRARLAKDVIRLIKELITLPDRMFGMKARINLLSYPDAAGRIAEFVKSL